MKKNGKINEEEIIADDSEDLQQDFKCLHAGWTWNFYKKFDWRLLWDEFCTETLPDGRLKYRTAWAFCKAKTRVTRERELMYEIIGPKPLLEKGEILRAPWLGDWKKRRQNTFWSDEDPTKFAAIKRAFKERANKLEAMKAIGPMTIKWMERISGLADKLDESFGGSPINAKYPPDHPKNVNRMQFYLQWMQAIFLMEKKAWNAWLVSNGISPSSLATYAEMAANGQPIPAANGLQAGNGQMLQLPDGLTVDHILAAHTMKKKAEMFGMDLGSEYQTIEGEVVEEDKKNSKPH